MCYTAAMKVIRETAIVRISEMDIWQFLTHTSRDSYLAWHPHDHLDYKTVKTPLMRQASGRKCITKSVLVGACTNFTALLRSQFPASISSSNRPAYLSMWV